jgi:hypothetical protein
MDPSDLAEQRHLLLPSSYDRLHLNQWSSGEDRLVSSDDYDACCTHEGVLGPDTGQTPYVIGADLGLRIDRTVLSVCHRHGDTIVLDRQIVMQGTSTDPVRLADIENALVSLVRDYHRAKVRIDPWQAAGLAQRLRDSGVSVEEWSFTTQSVGRLAANLHQLLREHRMSLPADDSGLRDELLNVRLRANSAGVIRLDHDAGHHDDRAVSLGLAALALVEKSTAGRASLSVPSFDMLDPVAAKPLREGLASHGITAASTGRRRTTPEGPSRQDLARGLRGLPWRH